MLAAAVGLPIARGSAATLSPITPSAQACAPSFIGVPGSGQTSSSSAEMLAVQRTVVADAAAAGLTLQADQIVSYPAVPWYRFAADKLNALGASETAGEHTLLADIAGDHALSVAAGCPQASILLAGYSQGAEVVIRAVDSLSAAARATISVALLGNPSYVVPQAGDLDLNTNLRYFGIRPSLTGVKYTLRPDVLPRTIDVCAASDPICAYHLSEIPGLIDGRSSHYHYTSLTYGGATLTDVAAASLWSHRYIPPTAPPPPFVIGGTLIRGSGPYGFASVLKSASCPAPAANSTMYAALQSVIRGVVESGGEYFSTGGSFDLPISSTYQGNLDAYPYFEEYEVTCRDVPSTTPDTQILGFPAVASETINLTVNAPGAQVNITPNPAEVDTEVDVSSSGCPSYPGHIQTAQIFIDADPAGAGASTNLLQVTLPTNTNGGWAEQSVTLPGTVAAGDQLAGGGTCFADDGSSFEFTTEYVPVVP
jgi:hypothetical protein